MLTNSLTITFRSQKLCNDLILFLKDRNHRIIDQVVFGNNTQKSTTFDLSFPNTLYIEIENRGHNNFLIHLEKIKLSGLSLPDQIIDQICQFRQTGTDVTTISRSWNQLGTVSIDFFASDFIQYHLLYGNKITKT